MEQLLPLKKSIAKARDDSLSYLADPVVMQLLHSMGGQTVEAVVSDLEPTDSVLSGKVTLFGERLLVVADLHDAPNAARGASTQKWSASVSLCPRAALRRIVVEVPGQPAASNVAEWDHLASGTSVFLHYEGMECPVKATSSSTEDLEALLILARSDLEKI